MQIVGSFRIDPDHPCLAGHFPGRPVVPGVVLLDEVFALIRQARGGGPVGRVAQVKFLAPVLPGQTVIVSFDGPETGPLSFAGHVEGQLAMRGSGVVGLAA